MLERKMVQFFWLTVYLSGCCRTLRQQNVWMNEWMFYYRVTKKLGESQFSPTHASTKRRYREKTFSCTESVRAVRLESSRPKGPWIRKAERPLDMRWNESKTRTRQYTACERSQRPLESTTVLLATIY